jgi:cyclopropane-fatty-acyl-phospholipid synthase
LIRIFLQNRRAIDQSNRLPVKIANFGSRLFHWLHSNTRRGSLKNIEAHYDLGNDFYELWLDKTMAYSSGVFLNRSVSLQEASEEKFDRICRKLKLRPRDQVLEIGTGFGGFALHAAEKFGCNVTTTTISKQQFEFARTRFQTSEKNAKIELLQQDYRDLNGKYDKLVSIEMIEAVGHRFLDQYFRKCSSLLREDGSLVLQAIVMPERGYDRYLNSVDFIQRYVFPGGCLPSLGTILESVGRTTDLRFVHAEDMAPHYAETLRRWRAAFFSNLDEVRRQGYSEKLIRLWTFYLCYCEAAFEERRIGVLQIQFDKPLRRDDPIHISHHAAQPANS